MGKTPGVVSSWSDKCSVVSCATKNAAQGPNLVVETYRGVFHNYLYVNGCKSRITDLIASNGAW